MTVQGITQNEARVAVINGFKQAWSDAVDAIVSDSTERTLLKTRYLLDNAKPTQAFAKLIKPYAVCKIMSQTSGWRGLSGRLKRYDGSTEISLYLPNGVGMGKVDEMARPFEITFGKSNIGGVRFGELNPIDAGVAGAFFRKVIDVPFHFLNLELRS